MTYYVVIFVVSGGASMSVGAMAGGLAALTAAAIAMLILIFGIGWLNDITGADAALYYFWQQMAGVPTPNDVIVTCPPGEGGTLANLLWSVVAFGLTLVNLPIGVVAFCVAWIAMIAIVVTLIGAIVTVVCYFLGKREVIILSAGLGTLAICMIPIIAAGLMLRLEHYVSYALAC